MRCTEDVKTTAFPGNAPSESAGDQAHALTQKQA